MRTNSPRQIPQDVLVNVPQQRTVSEQYTENGRIGYRNVTKTFNTQVRQTKYKTVDNFSTKQIEGTVTLEFSYPSNAPFQHYVQVDGLLRRSIFESKTTFGEIVSKKEKAVFVLNSLKSNMKSDHLKGQKHIIVLGSKDLFANTEIIENEIPNY